MERLRDDLGAPPDVAVHEDPDRTTGRGYYTGMCFKIYAGVEDHGVEVADGGFVDWSQLLTGNRKERLLISGFGVDRITETLTAPTKSDPPPPQ
ncbi:ATP phosphoribosyltransferase regulatory subunit [Streptomyces lanatus]|uniref:ATP phosphoribosyltransferase regulatory subunit n=1 Tax=Streptomyces lanatus TaxID=66900 RepID=A0ABV1XLM5_9ACTN|nr:ATP phosphoribosyltransferase regulatory subunit [Streptomyces lanatus]